MGAELAPGLIVMKLINESNAKISLVFNKIESDFLKRAEDDVLFTCEPGMALEKLVETAIRSHDRIQETVQVTATVPSKLGDEAVALFKVSMSLKRKN